MKKEIATVTVYPTKESALLLEHPTHGPITADGAIWARDNFTARRLADGSVTTDAPKPAAKTVGTPVSATIVAPITATAIPSAASAADASTGNSK